MHTTLNSLSLGLTTCGSGNPSSGHKARSARRRSRSRSRSRSGRGAMSLGDGDGLRLHKFPSIQMSIAASELSRRRAAHVSPKAHPQKRSARTHARTQHRAVYSTAHRRRRSDRSLRLPRRRWTASAIKPITGSVHLPSAPLLGHSRLLSPEKMRIGGRLRSSAAKISSAFGENFRVASGV